jgi:hypothetical protein
LHDILAGDGQKQAVSDVKTTQKTRLKAGLLSPELALAAFRALMIVSKSPQLGLKKGGTSVMRYEFYPLNQAMIGASQDCLLSARPR